jgi:hypothetical protein
VSREVSSAVVGTVAWQQISVGKHRDRRKVDVDITGELLQIWDGYELLKTFLKEEKGEEV